MKIKNNPEQVLMKTLYSCITAFMLSLIVISCKKDQVPSQQFLDITSTPCKLKSYNDSRYTLEYGADNKLDKLNEAVFNIPGSGLPSGYRPVRKFQYENGYLRRILNEVKDYPEAAGEEASTKIKFDYGSLGLCCKLQL